MKKFSLSVLLESVLLVLLCANAFADTAIGTYMEVEHCNEFVSLRYSNSTSSELLARVPLGERVVCLADLGEFCYVGTQYGRGYIRSEYLEASDDDMTGRIPAFVPYSEISLFLSNFTEADFAWKKGCFNLGDNADMIEFAINHIWFNQREKLVWHDGSDEYNVSVDDSYIPSIVKRFFNVEPIDLEPLWVDYDGYSYKWYETGGHVKDGFAMLTAIYDIGNGYYKIWFETYGWGENWDNSVFALSMDEVRNRYAQGSNGYAMIHADDLSDSDTYYLVRYALNI